MSNKVLFDSLCNTVTTIQEGYRENIVEIFKKVILDSYDRNLADALEKYRLVTEKLITDTTPLELREEIYLKLNQELLYDVYAANKLHVGSSLGGSVSQGVLVGIVKKHVTELNNVLANYIHAHVSSEMVKD